jgi:hypothetical protein
MTLEVRGKKFEINLVNNWVHEQYMVIIQLVSEMTNNADLYSYATDDKEGEKKLRAIEKRRYEIKDTLIQLRREIIKEIVETNGYEYDEKWWTRSTEPDDINEFMTACIGKDASKGQSSKKK